MDAWGKAVATAVYEGARVCVCSYVGLVSVCVHTIYIHEEKKKKKKPVLTHTTKAACVCLSVCVLLAVWQTLGISPGLPTLMIL